MTTRGVWHVNEGNTLDAVRDLLRTLIDKKIVDALLVPVEGANDAVMPALVKNSTRLDRANPFAPVMAFNSARLVSMLTRGDHEGRIGVVLRSCEIRALIELVKFNQAKLDQVVTIGVDCFGTFSLADYETSRRETPDFLQQMFARAQNGNIAGLAFRPACSMCEYPTALRADIAIGFIGMDSTQILSVEMRDDIAAAMGLGADATAAEGRNRVVANLVAARTSRRDEILNSFRTQMRMGDGMAGHFANCLECTNCMNACPICYCKECYFRTENAVREPRELLRLAQRLGSVPMPPDALLFQMTRLNHMATSCVGCGMCEEACPQHIQLTAMFRAVGSRVQAVFDYSPGRDVGEKPPFMEFKREELVEIGEDR
jgi:formate dehydrogenase subunit beta